MQPGSRGSLPGVPVIVDAGDVVKGLQNASAEVRARLCEGDRKSAVFSQRLLQESPSARERREKAEREERHERSKARIAQWGDTVAGIHHRRLAAKLKRAEEAEKQRMQADIEWARLREREQKEHVTKARAEQFRQFPSVRETDSIALMASVIHERQLQLELNKKRRVQKQEEAKSEPQAPWYQKNCAKKLDTAQSFAQQTSSSEASSGQSRANLEMLKLWTTDPKASPELVGIDHYGGKNSSKAVYIEQDVHKNADIEDIYGSEKSAPYVRPGRQVSQDSHLKQDYEAAMQTRLNERAKRWEAERAEAKKAAEDLAKLDKMARMRYECEGQAVRDRDERTKQAAKELVTVLGSREQKILDSDERSRKSEVDPFVKITMRHNSRERERFAHQLECLSACREMAKEECERRSKSREEDKALRNIFEEAAKAENSQQVSIVNAQRAAKLSVTLENIKLAESRRQATDCITTKEKAELKALVEVNGSGFEKRHRKYIREIAGSLSRNGHDVDLLECHEKRLYGSSTTHAPKDA